MAAIKAEFVRELVGDPLGFLVDPAAHLLVCGISFSARLFVSVIRSFVHAAHYASRGGRGVTVLFGIVLTWAVLHIEYRIYRKRFV